MNYLDFLESEAIFSLREVAAQFKRPVLLFSGGKDSICMVHLCKKAFYPAKFPFPLMHIDTGHNFPETLEFRDDLVKELKETLIVRLVEETMIQKGIKDAEGKFPSRNAFQSLTLLDAIKEFKFDACIGGARRDEEKSRAKERMFSLRDKTGKWDPDNQRPEVWNVVNGFLKEGENMRVFPLSNWTELDVWAYIHRENISLPSLYFSHERECIQTPDGHLMNVNEFISISPTDKIVTEKVRYRTVGDMTCTAAVRSDAITVAEIINELKRTKISERGATRIDDRISDAGMEDRKKEGYF
jgi:sulfate adenylyltransferase subunit 2